MRCRIHLTKLELESPLPQVAQVWLGVALLAGSMYALRAVVEDIPPEDHVAIAVILCVLLLLAWMSLERTILTFSLPENRCWLSHHRLGKRQERSLPVSQIHSAKLEYDCTQQSAKTSFARIVLVTSLGMIPVSEHYLNDPDKLGRACQQINRFLQSQQRFLQA